MSNSEIDKAIREYNEMDATYEVANKTYSRSLWQREKAKIALDTANNLYKIACNSLYDTNVARTSKLDALRDVLSPGNSYIKDDTVYTVNSNGGLIITKLIPPDSEDVKA